MLIDLFESALRIQALREGPSGTLLEVIGTLRRVRPLGVVTPCRSAGSPHRPGRSCRRPHASAALRPRQRADRPRPRDTPRCTSPRHAPCGDVIDVPAVALLFSVERNTVYALVARAAYRGAAEVIR
jgi:hypothetical protein